MDWNTGQNSQQFGNPQYKPTNSSPLAFVFGGQQNSQSQSYSDPPLQNVFPYLNLSTIMEEFRKHLVRSILLMETES